MLENNPTIQNNERYNILQQIYIRFINIANYHGVKGIDNNNNIIPLSFKKGNTI